MSSIEITQGGELFLNETLLLGDDGHQQSAQDYLETLSSTSGLPHVMVQRNMDKIHYALTHLELILNGLTRGIDFSILDQGGAGWCAGLLFIQLQKRLVW